MEQKNLWHSLMEVEGKSLQGDIAECLAFLYKKYPNTPIKCRIPISATIDDTIDYGIVLEPSPIVNSKNLEFCFDDDPRKTNNKEKQEYEKPIMIKEGRLTDPQLEVIRKLEVVLQECHEVGICLIGMDSNLLAYNRVKLENAGYRIDPIVAQNALNQGYAVDDHDSYLDSGGW